MFYKLPPAGNRILVSGGGSRQALAHNWSPFAVHWYGSGTSALAAAVSAAILRKPVPAPEVLVPAYTCPDVISAILFAGAKPVLVDFTTQRPWLDLNAIDRCTNRNTVAIVAINFLGIRERIASLRAKAAVGDAVLIEDSAQSFPRDAQGIGESSGDLVVLSFGRGKPVSLLGGGAVLARDAALSRLLPQRTVRPSDMPARVGFRLRIAIYNFLRRPSAYWLLDALPFLGLGETVFKPLRAIEPATASLDSLGANIDAYRQDGRAQRHLCAMLADRKLRGVVDLAAACGENVTTRLLRYPLLIDAARDHVHTALQRAGLGSSRLYQQVLPTVAGIPASVRAQGEFPNAARFAASLITLPTHDNVTERDIARTIAIIEAEMPRAGGL